MANRGQQQYRGDQGFGASRQRGGGFRGSRQQSGGGQQFRGSSRGGGPRGRGGASGGAFGQQRQAPSEPLVPVETVMAVDNAKRAWVGSRGRPCDLIVNYFDLVLKEKKLHRYSVEVELVRKAEKAEDEQKESAGDDTKKPRQLRNRVACRHALWAFLKENFPEHYPFKCVYDDKAILLSTIDLGIGQERIGEVMCMDPNLDIEQTYRIILHHVGEFKMDLQILNLILTQLPRHPFGPLAGSVVCDIDRRFIVPKPGFQPLDLGECLQLLRGLVSAVKLGPNKKYLANYDIRHSAFVKPKINLLQFYALAHRINLADIPNPEMLSMNRDQRSEMNGFLHGMLLRKNYVGSNARSFRFVKVTDGHAGNTFIRELGDAYTVERYFREKKDITLRYPKLPLIQIGRPKGDEYVPMELLDVADKLQRIRMKLPDDIQAQTTQYTTVKPQSRFNFITKMMNECRVNEDPLAREFGVSVGLKFLQIQGRVIVEPHTHHVVKEKKPFGSGITVTLGVVNVNKAVREDSDLRTKIGQLKESCATLGLRFASEQYVPLDTRGPGLTKAWLEILKKKLGSNSLALFIIGDRDKHLYDEIKNLCDREVGLRTQVMKIKTFLRIGNFTLNANMFRKMNNKVGGVNIHVDTSQWKRFADKENATLFIGIDVTHPAPGDESFPSVAAMVANLDLGATKYASTVRIQPARCEEVLSAGEMFKERLMDFKKVNGFYPKQVLVFRDGVSESQFDMVNDREVALMKRQCKDMMKTPPKFTVIIVQKRHSTRFYAKDGGDQNGNVLPGTVVDRFITPENAKQFFMASHKGLLGTSKPINYHVTHDESNISADELQNCVNILCNLFGRASGPVSLPAPVYYAHLVCFRARSYVNALRKQRVFSQELKPEHFDAHNEIRPFMYFS